MAGKDVAGAEEILGVEDLLGSRREGSSFFVSNEI
jgi:hypothetical protein